jgi:hypothetical protein
VAPLIKVKVLVVNVPASIAIEKTVLTDELTATPVASLTGLTELITGKRSEPPPPPPPPPPPTEVISKEDEVVAVNVGLLVATRV